MKLTVYRRYHQRGAHVCLLALLALMLPVAAHAGAWTTPAGSLWAKVSWYRQTTDEWYTDSDQPILLADNTLGTRPAGRRQPYRFNGAYESTAVFLEAKYGIADGIDVGLQVPWFDQSFNDDTRIDSPAESGFSDVRISARWQLLDRPILLTLKGGAKIPTAEFRNEDGLIPVGEGQWDYDVVVQAGRSFWPIPAYANIDLGYRVRTENESIRRDPGDEWQVTAELGYSPLPSLMLAAKLEGLYGKAGRSFGLRNESLTQRITYLSPSVAYTLSGQTVMEGGLRISVGGRNFPAGRQLTIGLSTTGALPGALR
ncbi:MAG: transporter [bacterium]|nr:transporter [bacterium]